MILKNLYAEVEVKEPESEGQDTSMERHNMPIWIRK
jgi:hypothetical protein